MALATVARVGGRGVGIVMCLVLVGCGGSRTGRPPAPSATTSPPPTSVSTTRAPSITGEPIPGLTPQAVHGGLEKAGFTTGQPGGNAGFVTITSKRADATVSTYGKSAGEVVKIIAEADPAVAPTVLGTVAAVAVTGADARKAESWVKAELKQAPTGPTQTSAAQASYGRVPYELIVTAKSATLSIGRVTSR